MNEPMPWPAAVAIMVSALGLIAIKLLSLARARWRRRRMLIECDRDLHMLSLLSNLKTIINGCKGCLLHPSVDKWERDWMVTRGWRQDHIKRALAAVAAMQR